MGDSFHDFPPAPRTPAVEHIPAATYPPMYRIVCPDGTICADVNSTIEAFNAAHHADEKHRLYCTAHRILLVRTYTEIIRNEP